MNNIYLINDNKFKGIYLSYNFTYPIVGDKVAQDVVLASILSKCSKKYLNQKEIDRKLANLYGAEFNTNVEKIGDLYNIEFRMEFINKKYLPENVDVLDECLDFIYDILYDPMIVNETFDSNIVEREKSFVLDKIRQKKDDKMKYAVTRTEELMCKDEPFSTYLYGNEEDINKITPNTLYTRYLDIISNSNILVALSGNLNGYDNLEQTIENKFSNRLNKNKDISNLKELINIKSQRSTIQFQEITEHNDTVQSVMALGLNIDGDLTNNDMYILNIYNAILGTTPSSKLFVNFREKESLAYVVRSRYYRYKGIFVIYAGIEKQNYEKAKMVIKKQLDDMVNGNITQEEFNTAKSSLISDIREWNDSKIALAKMVISNVLSEGNANITVEDMIDKMQAVSLQNVIDMAKRINTKIIYLLGGEENA